MLNILIHKIAATIATIAIGASSLLGFAPVPEKAPASLGATIPTTIALFSTSLATSIGPNDTTMTLVSGIDKDGNALTGAVYGLTIDEGTSLEEFVLATCASTACSGMTRGVSVVTGTSSVATLKKAHRRGASVKITDAPALLVLSRILNGNETLPNVLTYDSAKTIASSSNQLVYANYLYQNYAGLDSNQTFTGQKTFNATTTQNGVFLLNALGTTSYTCDGSSPLTALCAKSYMDGLALAGAPNASTIQKGVSEQATTAEVNAGSATGSTGAPLFISPDALAASTLLTAGIATSTTLIPIPLQPINGSADVLQNSSTTQAYVGLINIPYKMSATSLLVQPGNYSSSGSFKVGLYDTNGTKLWQATSTSVTSNASTSVALSPTWVINPGVYYIAYVGLYGGSFQVYTHNAASVYSASFGATTNKLKYSGTLNVASGTLPTTFATSSIVNTEDTTLLFRLDN